MQTIERPCETRRSCGSGAKWNVRQRGCREDRRPNIYNIYQNKKKSKLERPGARRAFTEEEEESLVIHIRTVADLGMPIDSLDLRMIAKAYLQRIGRVVACFLPLLEGQ